MATCTADDAFKSPDRRHLEWLLRVRSRFLPAILFCSALVAASLLVGIALEFNAWTADEIILGPFPMEPGTRTAVVSIGQASATIPCCIGPRSDHPDHPVASTLRAWLNGRELGPAHTLHADIRAGTTAGFSHWTGYLRFFVPESMANDQTATLHVRYPLQYSITFLTLNAGVAIALLFIVGIGAISTTANLLHAALRTGLVISAAALPIYFIFLIIGHLTLQPLAVSYIFRYVPIDRPLNTFEPYFPRLLVIVAIVLTALNWVVGSDPSHARLAELKTLTWWRRLGFFSTAAVFYIFIAAAAWSGHPVWYDGQDSLAGLVPNYDATGYFHGSLNYLFFGEIDAWNLRRPFAALFRSETVAAGAFDYTGTLLGQIAAVSLSIYLATTAVIRWRGVSAGIAFWSMAFILSRPVLMTVMTEPLALFWAFCAIPFLIHGLQHRSFRHVWLAMTFLYVALFVRMGAMFVIPFLLLWALLYAGDTLKQRAISACCAASTFALILLVNALISKTYSPTGQLGSNFAFTLCGMSVGGTWHDCAAQYGAQLRQFAGDDEAAAARFLYRVTIDNLLHQPIIFARSMWSGFHRYLNDLPSLPTTWYRWDGATALESSFLYVLSLLGWIYALRPRANSAAVAFALFVGLGIITSVPFVYFDDARRVLYATNPLVALLIAGGLFAPGALRLRSATLQCRTGAITIVAAVAIALMLPLGLRLIGIGKSGRPATSGLADKEIIIAGHAMQTGFVVLPDSTQQLPGVPSMTISKLREFLTVAGLPRTIIESLPQPPFAFILPFELERPSFYIYLVPPEVFREKTVDRWKVTVAPFASMWAIATTATPLK